MLSIGQAKNRIGSFRNPLKVVMSIAVALSVGFLIASCLSQGKISPTTKPTQQPLSPTSNPAVQPPIGVSDWLIYSNSILGYEISYPPDWRIGESMSMGYPYVTLSSPILQAKSTEEGSEVGQGAFLEISAEEFRAVVPANEYLRNFARTDRGPDGRWLDVETEEFPSNVWGFEGYYLVSRSGEILQHAHGALVPYPEGSLLIQIRLTVPDSKSANTDAYVETFNQILASLKFTPPTALSNSLLSAAESVKITPDVTDLEIGSVTDDHFLTLPFFSHPEMHVQQGWIYDWGVTHSATDYIKGTIDQSPWETFDVIAAYDGEACGNCTNGGPTGSSNIWITHNVNGKTFYSLYGHLATIETFIPLGDKTKKTTTPVKRGQKIGTAGSTGVYDQSGTARPGWVHLHFEVQINVNNVGVPIDPYDLNTIIKDEYYPNPNYISMGPDHLFTSDPPSYFGGSSDVSQGAGPTVDVVEIIDSSGSMAWNDPNGQRRNAAKTFVDTSIEGDFVGVVDFDGVSRLASPLLKLPENRQTLFSAIDTIDAVGGTNLGAGLQAGCNALINSNSSNAKKGAIFLTDGQGSYNGQAACYSSRGWPIYAFGLDDADDALLTDIATSTGGEYKRLPATNLTCEFQRVRNKISGIDSSPCQSAYINPLQHIFYLLRVLHGQAQITMSTSWGGSDVEMSLASPSGRIIDRNTIAEDVVHDVSGTHEVFTIINPEPGEWKVGLFGADIPASGEEVVFGFTSFPQHSADTTGVFRPSNGLLYLKNSNDTGFADIAINYGIPGDYPVVGDWDGNGTTTIGIYRNGSFYLRNSNIIGFAEIVFPFGQLGDQPIAGDWNGDGIDTIGIYRPSTGQFQLRNSNDAGPPQMSFYLGNVGDVGVAGDWNGDGIDTTGVFRPSNGIIFLKNTNTTGIADIALNYGLSGDKPLTGDWNGDGIDTIGVYRNGTFLLRNENTVGFADIVFGLGNPGDMPIAGDWDGMP